MCSLVVLVQGLYYRIGRRSLWGPMRPSQDDQRINKTRRGRTAAQNQQKARTDARTNKWNAWRQHASSKHPPRSEEQHQSSSRSPWDYTDHVQTTHKGRTWQQQDYEHNGISDVQTKWEEVDPGVHQTGLGAWQQQTSTGRPLTDRAAATIDSEEVWVRATRQRTDVQSWDTSHSSMVTQVGHVNYVNDLR